MNILELYKNLDLDKTITLSTNNGGVLTIQIHDAFIFMNDIKLKDELEFLEHLANSKSKPTQETIDGFLKHLLFDAKLAKKFVQWQRNAHAA